MRKLRVGIVGCGNIFPMHAISIKKNKDLELVGVCDIKKDRANKEAERFETKAYYDFDTMLQEGNLDVLHICTPHYLHAPMTIKAVNHNVHVLTEKPMAINVEDGKAMIKAAKDNNKTLGVIFQNRYNKGAAFLKETLDSGKLGKIYSAKCQVTWDRSDAYYQKSDWKGTWDKEGGGAVIDQAIHTIDLMRWFVNDEIESIDASIANRVHETIDVEDTAEGLIAFKNGIRANFHVINYNTMDSPVTIELHCEHGIATYTDGLTHIKYYDNAQEIVDADPRERLDYGDVKSYWGVSHVKQINAFYEDLKNRKEPIINGNEALITQKIVNGIYQSGKTYKKVLFKDL